MTTIIQVPLAQLRPGGADVNARKEKTEVEGLAASIATHGLLVPLLVRKRADPDTDEFDVMDGNRRLAALKMLQKAPGKSVQQATPDFDAIPCIDVVHNSALELSMVVNVDRAELHLVDRFEVFAALVQAGETVEALSKRYNMKIAEVRQALALGRMAPAVRDAWRSGDIGADAAEAFTITQDHKAQAAALKKIGKHGNAYTVQRALMGDEMPSTGRLLKIVGFEAYEKAGHEINATLFSDDRRDDLSVSDAPALVRMVEEKIEAKCEQLIADGWKWAIPKSKQPKDAQAWRRTGVQHNAAKDQKAALGCIVGLDYSDEIKIEYGIAKPGDKVSVPKSAKVKKAEAKQREKRKEETGGISNALALRLSKQLTLAVADAMPNGITGEDAEALAIAVLAARNDATPSLTLRARSYNEDDPREDNEFGKYLKLAQRKSIGEKRELLMRWIAVAVDLTSNSAEDFVKILHPGKGEHSDVRLVAELINEKMLRAAAIKHFDAKDYFASVSKPLIVEAVRETLGKEHAERVAKMKSAEAAKYATTHVKNWLPQSLRLK